MASTIAVQDLINYARVHVKLAPLASLGGFADQPALKWANQIKKKIIRHKYNWEWNRKTVPDFLTVDGVDEYVSSVSDIGWLEDCWCEQEASTASPKYGVYLDVRRNIRKGHIRQDPQMIAFMLDRKRRPVFRLDQYANGTIWRLFVDYQRKPAKITGLDQTFDPIPDEMEDYLHEFFLAFALRIVDKAEAFRQLRYAEELLDEYAAAESNEPDSNRFVPERPMALGG